MIPEYIQSHYKEAGITPKFVLSGDTAIYVIVDPQTMDWWSKTTLSSPDKFVLTYTYKTKKEGRC